MTVRTVPPTPALPRCAGEGDGRCLASVLLATTDQSSALLIGRSEQFSVLLLLCIRPEQLEKLRSGEICLHQIPNHCPLGLKPSGLLLPRFVSSSY